LPRGFDVMARELETGRGDMASVDPFQAQALDMITNPRVRTAFDISREPQAVRDRYGYGGALKFLQARRLVEAGVPVVTMTFGDDHRDCLRPGASGSWDTHERNFVCLRTVMPRLDRAVHTLILDL